MKILKLDVYDTYSASHDPDLGMVTVAGVQRIYKQQSPKDDALDSLEKLSNRTRGEILKKYCPECGTKKEHCLCKPAEKSFQDDREVELKIFSFDFGESLIAFKVPERYMNEHRWGAGTAKVDLSNIVTRV